MNFIFLVFVFLTASVYSQNQPYLLHQNWQFKQAGTSVYHKATVPGCVHTDLLANQMIPDPFYGNNEQKIQWINKADWEYSTLFNLPENLQNQNHLELVFDGLDTYAEVYLNGQLLLRANNMFRQWKAEVQSLVKKNKNILTVKFASAKRVTDSLARKNLPLIIPDNNRLYARKAQYQFGWDFAPTFPTCGIWKKVYLQSWQDNKLDQVSHQVTKLEPREARIKIRSKIFATTAQKITVYATIKEQQKLPAASYQLKKSIELQQGLDLQTDKTVAFKTLNLEPGWNPIEIPYTIPSPKIWNPNGSGKQPLYTMELIAGDQYATKTIGLRTIELVTKADSISDFRELRTEKGTGFYFKVNGKPVYCKGANYVPADMFPSRVSKAKYRDLLVAAKEANMNMLRIWGGGIYEDDYFYELCDSLGIMIWQDFMFAGSMLPTDSAFASNIQQEALEQVQRLQHHPCMALWCGNNEIDEAWHNWGWQKQFKLTPEDSTLLWKSYTHIFHKILPEIVQLNNAGINYWPSSPSIGWGRKESMTQGDSHYWGVWWGMEPIEVYETKIPRFMSEYGMQSMPSIAAINKFAKPNEWDTTGAIIKMHQKHPTGFQNLQQYMNRLFALVTDTGDMQNTPPKKKQFKQAEFEYMVYLTQVLQAEAYKKAILSHRSKMPYNMGTLLWQLNDPWPVASWSIIDYFGNKKPAYHQVKESYAPQVIFNRKNKPDTIETTIINDSGEDFTKLDFNFMTFDQYGYPDFFVDSAFSLAPYSVKNIRMPVDTADGMLNNFSRSFLTRTVPGNDSIIYRAFQNDHYGQFAILKNSNWSKPYLVPIFEWVKGKLMVTAIKIKKQNTRYEFIYNGFLYHPLYQNIVDAPYQYFLIERGQSEKIKLNRSLTEKEFLQLRLVCLNFKEIF